ncbi:hypothetical protein [Nocardia sp. NPDC050435]|uniref:hypothetical protein n=1 Tax=Nocardia sp. NPDC050435 TaxID=3155040 RepID=UPI003410139E
MSTDHGTDTPATDSGSPGGGRGHTTLILALVVVGLVVVGGVAAFLSREDDQPAGSGPAPSSPTAAPAPSTGAAAPGFSLPMTDDFGRRIDIPNSEYGQTLAQTAPQRTPADPEWLTAAPAGTRDKGGWQRVTGAVVPFSTSDGPTGIRDGMPTGWAHTPQGCALAAAYLSWEVNARMGDRVIRERGVISTPADLAKFDADRAAGKIPDRAPAVLLRWLLASDAFKIVSWAPDLCVLKLATRNEPDKATQAARWLGTTVSMVWTEGTWKLRPPAGGNPPQEALASLSGWTTW